MRNIYYLIALLFVIFSLVSIYSYIPKEKDFFKFADEGHYLDYSRYIYKNGIKSYPKLFDNFVNNKDNWIWPTPLRVGYFLLVDFWFKIFGPSFTSMAKFSLFCFGLSLIFCLFFSKKLFGKEIASVFVLLLAFSPLTMAMAKRALSDSAGNLFVSLSIWMFIYFLSNKKISNFILLLICCILSILIREQSFFLIGFFILFLIIYNFIYKKNISLKYFLLILFIPPFIVGLIWLISSFNLANLINVILIKINDITHLLPSVTNYYPMLFCKGPWFRYIIDYLLLSPLVTILAISFVIYSLVNRDVFKDYKISYFLVLFFFTYLLFGGLDYYKNVRYIIGLDMIMRIFVVFMLREIFKKSESVHNFVFLTILFLCIIDYLNFMDLFYKNNIYDPTSFMLLKSKFMIP